MCFSVQFRSTHNLVAANAAYWFWNLHAQVMTQYGFFNQTGTVILDCVVHFWNFVTNKREGVTHFMITDDLKKTNMQVCQFIQDIFKYYDDLHFQHSQQHLNTLSIFSDNCGYQFKSRLNILCMHFVLYCARNIPNNWYVSACLQKTTGLDGWLCGTWREPFVSDFA